MCLKEAIAKIQKAGVGNTRIIPSDDGKFILEINEGGQWKKILKPMSKVMLEDAVKQASNKVIMG